MKWRLKNRYNIKDNSFSSNLKRSIQVESWFDREKEPVYIEIDLVHHSGQSLQRQSIYAMKATDIGHNLFHLGIRQWYGQLMH